jgi:hypothetical protein
MPKPKGLPQGFTQGTQDTSPHPIKLSTEKQAQETKESKQHKEKSLPTKTVVTIHIPIDTVERIRDAVYWTPGLTLASLAEQALEEMVARMEEERGEPFPPRAGKIKTGRPVK